MLLNQNKQNCGFTLIELSVVLVIIGIILSMIYVKGTATIQETKVTQIISQISDISSAIVQFKNRYQALPGDYAATAQSISNLNPSCLQGAANGGNWDGLISATYTASKLTGGEAVCVPEHLYQAGLVKVDGTDVKTGFLSIVSPYGDINIVTKSASHAPTAFNPNIVTVLELANLPCDVVQELDRKIDDDNIGTGNAVASSASGTLMSSCTGNSIIPFYVVAL